MRALGAQSHMGETGQPGVSASIGLPCIDRGQRSTAQLAHLCSEARPSPKTGLNPRPADCARQPMVYAGTYVAGRIARTAKSVSSFGAMPTIGAGLECSGSARFSTETLGASSSDYPQCRQAFAHCLWGNAR